MKKGVGTYENLIAHYNRNYSPYQECSCGKMVIEKRMAKHLKSKLHAYLLGYKEGCEILKQKINGE